MFDLIWEFTNELLGLQRESSELALRHMSWRAFVIFWFAIVVIRFANRRLLGQSAGFDIIVAVVLGSVLSRAINGNAAFFPTIGATALLIGLHHVLATLTFQFHAFSQLVKGRSHVLVRDGKVQDDAMRRCKITSEDLVENLRLSGGVEHARGVAEARVERNGAISVVKSRTPGVDETGAARQQRPRSS